MLTELGDAFTEWPWLLPAVVFVVGLLVGSFLNVVIYRLPVMLEREWRKQAREILGPEPEPVSRAPDSLSEADAGTVSVEILAEYAVLPEAVPAPAPEPEPERFNLLVPRSRCPKCHAPIQAHQNIPVVSWLLLGGRCANCRAPIPARYPVVELVTAVLSAVVAVRFGWHWQTLAALVLTWSLVALTVIDLDHTLLPDAITLPLLWVGLLLSLAWQPGLTAPAPTDAYSAILGACAGYLSLWSVYWAFKLLTGKEGMGYGDFKLFGAIGAWLGWQMLPLVLLLSAFAGAVVGVTLILVRGRDRNVPIPFGPYLAAAGWIALMWGPQIVGGYVKLVGL